MRLRKIMEYLGVQPKWTHAWNGIGIKKHAKPEGIVKD
jgi:hypothetical protein